MKMRGVWVQYGDAGETDPHRLTRIMLSVVIENEIQDAWILASRLAGKLHTIAALHRGPNSEPLIKATRETIQAIEEMESLLAWPIAEIKEGAR